MYLMDVKFGIVSKLIIHQSKYAAKGGLINQKGVS